MIAIQKNGRMIICLMRRIYKMTKAKINTCPYCEKVSVVSTHFKIYVCDDCYENNQIEKKKELRKK